MPCCSLLFDCTKKPRQEQSGGLLTWQVSSAGRQPTMLGRLLALQSTCGSWQGEGGVALPRV